jgi:cyclase
VRIAADGLDACNGLDVRGGAKPRAVKWQDLREASLDIPIKLAFGAVLAATLASFAPSSGAQQQDPLERMKALIADYKLKEPLVVTKLTDNVYLAKGGVGSNQDNVGFVVGKTGVILVDSKDSAESETNVLAEIAKITPKPVNTVIVLHSDHMLGLAALPAGVTIIAHENTKKEMQVATARDAAPQDRLPTKLITKNEKLTIDGVRVQLFHWAPAHTSGDLIVYFPAEKVVFGGDLIVTDRAPDDMPLHSDLHGSAKGWIENMKGMLALKADIYVTGHGDTFTKDDVKEKLVLVQAKWDKIQAMVMQGKSLDDVKTALGESTAPPKRNAQGNLPPLTTTEIMYNEMTNKS